MDGIFASNQNQQPKLVAFGSPVAAQRTPITNQMPLQNTYVPDQYGQAGYGQTTVGSVPLNVLANDYRRPVNYVSMRLEQKLSSMGISTTTDLLRRCDTPTKRNWLISMAASFDPQLTKENVRAVLQSWLSQADLLRTGMQPDTARLLQASGIHDSMTLGRYFSPLDKLALQGTLSSNAIRFGYRMPTYDELSANVDAAQRLPMAVRW